ncbi:MAG: ferredoxin family protein [Firmicutes bacterium]|nr:ferredoxin family protein [Bacillota bacterium]
MRFKVPRDQIPWHPTIDGDKCSGCRTCFEFCRNGVYEWDAQNEKPVVKRPHSCIVGCSACSAKCPSEAIAFPPLSILKQYI